MRQARTRVLRKLAERGLTLSVCESCTGGMLSSLITGRPGVSKVFAGGIVAYSDAVKRRLGRVKLKTLKDHGAVSAQTAKEMARNVRAITRTAVGVAVTGIAGPSGATAKKPVGLVFVAVAAARRIVVVKHRFAGGRARIRRDACRAALELIGKVAL